MALGSKEAKQARNYEQKMQAEERARQAEMQAKQAEKRERETQEQAANSPAEKLQTLQVALPRAGGIGDRDPGQMRADHLPRQSGREFLD